MADMTVIEAPEAARAALSPLRRRILSLLDEPASATELANRLGLPRQKVHYHLTVLESHRLVELAEVRQRRGFEERRFRRSGTVVVAPDLLDMPEPVDDLSAEAVVAAAADVIRAIGGLSAAGTRHPTATLTSEVSFASPGEMRRFLEAVGDLAAEFDCGSRPGSLPMTVTLLSHVTKGDTT